ncbi:MAG: 3-oxoacyl-ACP reductase FabG [Actinomycetota bacterium]|nr:3-oxoacyl-ACP reductase FabG [Actinomycetota bacterium]
MSEVQAGEAVGTSRVALVTGGSGGIGRATVGALADAGHRVAVGYRRDRVGAEKAAAEIDGVAVEVDVSEPESVDAAFSLVEEALGPVEVLVNNAGVNADGLILRMSDEQWRRVLATNLDGAFYVTRRASATMLRRRFGRIVNVGSVVGSTGAPGQANYAAAKAGLIGLTRSVARELASRGVTCNLVAPGPITTAMTDALSEKRLAELVGLVPLGRTGTAEEVAAVIAFLCSNAASYVTGAVVPVDGGTSMGH